MSNFYEKQKHVIFVSQVSFAVAITLLVSCSNETKMTGNSKRTMPGIPNAENALPEQQASNVGTDVQQQTAPVTNAAPMTPTTPNDSATAQAAAQAAAAQEAVVAAYDNTPANLPRAFTCAAGLIYLNVYTLLTQ